MLLIILYGYITHGFNKVTPIGRVLAPFACDEEESQGKL